MWALSSASKSRSTEACGHCYHRFSRPRGNVLVRAFWCTSKKRRHPIWAPSWSYGRVRKTHTHLPKPENVLSKTISSGSDSGCHSAWKPDSGTLTDVNMNQVPTWSASFLMLQIFVISDKSVSAGKLTSTWPSTLMVITLLLPAGRNPASSNITASKGIPLYRDLVCRPQRGSV